MIEAVPELADYLPEGAGEGYMQQQEEEGDKDEERYGEGGGGDDSCTVSPVSEISHSSRARNGNSGKTWGTHTHTHVAMAMTRSRSKVVAAAGSTAGPSLPPQLSRQLKRPRVEQGPVQAFQNEKKHKHQQERPVIVSRRGRHRGARAAVLRDTCA